MAVELQVRSGLFATMVARALQRTQMDTCLPASPSFYVDHADPLPDLADWSSDGITATLSLPIDVYVVRREDLLASAGSIPGGARTPAGRLRLVIEVKAEQAALIVSVRNVDFGIAEGALGGAADAVRDAVLAAAGAGMRLELGALLGNVGIDPTTAGGVVMLVDDLLVARFGVGVDPPVRVAHPYEWALFLDAGSVEGLVRARIPTSIPPLSSVQTTVRWTPVGSFASVAASVRGPVPVPDPFSCRISTSFQFSLSMPKQEPVLRLDANYSLEVETGLLGLSLLLQVAEEVAESELERKAIDPARFGAVRTGDRSFAIQLPLPELKVAGQPWRYEGLTAGPGGLVIGGSVNLPVDLSRVLLRTATRRFSGSNVATLFCSRGAPNTERAEPGFFSTVAVVEYEQGGSLCEVEVLPPGKGYEAHLTLPKHGFGGAPRPGKGSIFMRFGVEDANEVGEVIRLIVRTPRGVRCCDLGQPEHFSLNEDGTVLGGQVIFVEDCHRLPPNFPDMTPDEYDRWTGVIWYTYWGLVPGKDYDPDNPPILPATLDEIPDGWNDVDTTDTMITVIPETKVGPGETETIVVVPEEFRVIEVEIGLEGPGG